MFVFQNPIPSSGTGRNRCARERGRGRGIPLTRLTVFMIFQIPKSSSARFDRKINTQTFTRRFNRFKLSVCHSKCLLAFAIRFSWSAKERLLMPHDPVNTSLASNQHVWTCARFQTTAVVVSTRLLVFVSLRSVLFSKIIGLRPRNTIKDQTRL